MTGIWIEPANGTSRSYVWLCSACMRRVYARPRCGLKDGSRAKAIDYKFCPYCGTEMTGERRDGMKRYVDPETVKRFVKETLGIDGLALQAFNVTEKISFYRRGDGQKKEGRC